MATPLVGHHSTHFKLLAPFNIGMLSNLEAAPHNIPVLDAAQLLKHIYEALLDHHLVHGRIGQFAECASLQELYPGCGEKVGIGPIHVGHIHLHGIIVAEPHIVAARRSGEMRRGRRHTLHATQIAELRHESLPFILRHTREIHMRQILIFESHVESGHHVILPPDNHQQTQQQSRGEKFQ